MITLKEHFYESIRQIIENARSKVYQTVNTTLVITYWEIGKKIVEEEQQGEDRAEYGKFIIRNLAERLTDEFGKGFDQSNLRYMRLFYQAFPIRDALRHNLSWTHYRLMLKVNDEKARDFYVRECAENNWSTRQLERQINSFYYQRLLASRDKELVRKEAESRNEPLRPADLLKNPYILEFLDLKENTDYLERDLETAILSKLQDFLLELGKGFSFVARQ